MIAADATIHRVKVVASLLPTPTDRPLDEDDPDDEDQYQDAVYEEPDLAGPWDYSAEDWVTADEPPYGDR
jgi:hypothetical protein